MWGAVCMITPVSRCLWMHLRLMCLAVHVFFLLAFVQYLHWMRVCMAAWTDRCHCGGCMSWGSAAWLVSSPGQLIDSASCSVRCLLAFAVEAGMGNSPPSRLCQTDRKVWIFRRLFACRNDNLERKKKGAFTHDAEDTTRLHLCVLQHSHPDCVCHRR